ncbi:hypothetical protein [Haloprofundus halobius]|nr:hypothetical protein [Haloprofundus halobius]
MNVRVATPDDASAVADIARESWHAAYDELVVVAAVSDLRDE